jgi:FtsZ-interacting cell division protein ZipA
MDKKKILIIGGVIAVVGIAIFMLNKSKKSAKNVDETPADVTPTGASAPTDADATAPAKEPLTKRKEKKRACGRKPLNKERKAEWQKCVDAGGTASFEGSDFDQFEDDYMDFIGLDLDL